MKLQTLTAFRYGAAALREELFPQGCSLCGKALYSGAEAFYGLCAPCRTLLSAGLTSSGENRCDLCGQPLISEIGTCLSCRNGKLRSFDRILSLFPYTGKYQKLLKAFKFGKRPSLGNFFADMLIQGLDLLFPEEKPGMGWVPVPPRPGKIKKTGWDQVEYLAKLLDRNRLAGRIPENPPVFRCLTRLPSESQKELNREKRQTNLKKRIILNTSQELPKTALLFDDVYTTGSTMDACAEALKSGGVEKVYGICLFYD
jgi:ComF family protein